jgi:hypothetical protein
MGSINVHHEQVTNLKGPRHDNGCMILHQDFRNVYIHLWSTAVLLYIPNKGSNLYQLTPPRLQYASLSSRRFPF